MTDAISNMVGLVALAVMALSVMAAIHFGATYQWVELGVCVILFGIGSWLFSWAETL